MPSFGWLRLTAVLSAVMVVVGCSSQRERIEQSARTAGSWGATARTTSAALARDAVPRVYARQVLRAAIESRRQLSQQPEWPSLPENARTRLDDAIRVLAASLGMRADPLSRQ